MAAEITAWGGFTCKNGSGPTYEASRGKYSIDQSGNKGMEDVRQTIGTSPEALGVGELATLGLIHIENKGSYPVTIRNGSGGTDVVKYKPGESFTFRLATNTPFAYATGGSSDIIYTLIED